MTQTIELDSSAAAGRRRPCPRRRRTAGGRTSRSSASTLEARPRRAAAATRAPRASAGRSVVSPSVAERTESVSVRAPSSQSARSKMPGLALEPAAVRLLDVLAARARRRRRRSGRPARAGRAPRGARGAARPRVSMCRSERNGQMTSGTRSVTGGSRRSPRRRSTSSDDAGALGRGARDLEHARRGVDADHVDAGPRDRAPRSGRCRRRARRPGRPTRAPRST